MKRLIVYVHGKGGSPAEAEHYAPLFPGQDVIGLSYRAQNPREAAGEFPQLFDASCAGYDSVVLIANSIGAYFSMAGLAGKPIELALFISPVVDLERLMLDLLAQEGATEDTLRSRGELPTAFGETLFWDDLCYVRAHPIRWDAPTRILYGDRDALTTRETVTSFADRIGAPLTVLAGGEHWFHTDAQMAFLDRWIADCVRQQTDRR